MFLSPLQVRLQPVGRLQIEGACPNGSASIWMRDLFDSLEMIESQLNAVFADPAIDAPLFDVDPASGEARDAEVVFSSDFAQAQQPAAELDYSQKHVR